MFRTSTTSSDAPENTPTKRRRQGRGLGPFTSGHLTVIVVTLVIVVAFPFAAFAVTGNNVFVTDATSGNHAGVANGRLKVDAGTSFGLVPTVSQGGVVDVRDAIPTHPFVTGPKHTPGADTTIAGPLNTRFAITTITVTNNCNCTYEVDVFAVTNVFNGKYWLETFTVAPHQALHYTYPTPIVVTPQGSPASAALEVDAVPIPGSGTDNGAVYTSMVGWTTS